MALREGQPGHGGRVRTAPCDKATRTGRFRKAGQFLDAAVLVQAISEGGSDLDDADVTLCVHSGIASADVICCAVLGKARPGREPRRGDRAAQDRRPGGGQTPRCPARHEDQGRLHSPRHRAPGRQARPARRRAALREGAAGAGEGRLTTRDALGWRSGRGDDLRALRTRWPRTVHTSRSPLSCPHAPGRYHCGPRPTLLGAACARDESPALRAAGVAPVQAAAPAGRR